MTTPKDGGSAFGHGNPEQGGDPGASLRDYFAAQALAGQLTALTNPDIAKFIATDSEKSGLSTEAYMACRAFDFADAMLSARDVQGESK